MGNSRPTRIFKYLYWFIFYEKIFTDDNIPIDRVIYYIKDIFERVECLASGAIPESVQEEIKNGILNAIFKQLIESYSKIKKVSEHGREIMLSDFNMIMGGLGKLVQSEVSENKKNCEEYIKAWH